MPKETENVSLVSAGTFSYKNVPVESNIPENGLIIIYTDIICQGRYVVKYRDAYIYCIIMEKKRIFNLKILNIILWTYGLQMKSEY